MRNLGPDRETNGETRPAGVLVDDAATGEPQEPAVPLAHGLCQEPLGALHLAAIGIEDTGTALVLTHSDDLGATWAAPTLVRPDDPVMPHLAPVWVDGRVYVAVVPGADDEAEVCSVESSGEARVCQGVGSPRINQLSVGSGAVQVLVDVGVADWEARALALH